MTHQLFFPVEFINRELDYRLFLAAASLTAGVERIFIGKNPSLLRLSDHARGGLWVGKCIRPYFTDELTSYLRLRGRDIRLVHLDEEGGVYMGGEKEWAAQLKARLDPAQLTSDDTICTWGTFQRDVFAAAAPAGPAVLATGHPRFDLPKDRYRAFYEAETTDIRRRHGDFILVNGNFPRVNHALGPSYVFSENYNYDPGDDQRRQAFLGRWAHFKSIFAHTVSLSHALAAAFPERRVIVRPHPSENREFYRSSFRGVPNLEMVFEGNVIPWLRAASAVVHNGCTTALEAALAGVPVITFQPFEDVRYDKYLPNALGVRVTSPEEAVRAIRAGDGGAAQVPARARALVANVESNAFDRLVEVFLERGRAGGTFDEPAGRVALARAWGVERAKRVVRPVFPARRKMAKRVKSKFPGLRRKDLRSRLARIERVVGQRVRVTYFDETAVMLERA